MLKIGTSGFVYSSGRKGEELIRSLLNYSFTEPVKIIAAGQGWPCETKYYSDISEFYNKIDLYVSTSKTEGIGYGVLESLQLGIPVVIPIGVGIYDELKDCTGIYRYEKGNFSDFVSKIEQFIIDFNSGKIDKFCLKSSVSSFTIDSWLDGHLRVFENGLYNLPLDKHINSWENNSCVVYVAYGENARNCCINAMISFKKFLPNVDIVLISDSPLGIEDVFINHPDTDIGARNAKTKLDSLVPENYEYILYLDSDTEVVSSDVTLFYKLLNDDWELIFCTNPSRFALVSHMYREDNKGEMDELISFLGSEKLLQLNGGVFAYRRNETTREFMKRWNEEWNVYAKRDQSPLDKVLYSMPIRLFVLGVEWNTVTRYYDANRTAGILHYPMTARRWAGRIDGRLDSKEAWSKVNSGKS